MPNEVPTTHIDDILITARRDPVTSVVQLWWRYRSRDTGTYSQNRLGHSGIRSLRIVPDANISFQDLDGSVIPVDFETAVPPEALEQVVQLLELWANGTTNFSSDQQAVLEDALGAITYLAGQNAGLVFRLDPGGKLAVDVLMGAQLNTLGMPVIDAGYATIWVNPSLVSNPQMWGQELSTIVLHEILHLNPDFGAADVARWTRNGQRPLSDPANLARYNAYHQSVFWGRARVIRRILRSTALTLSAQPVVLMGTTGHDTLQGTATFNDVEGQDGNNILSATGLADVLWGGEGDDTYVFTTTSSDYTITDDGGSNLLQIDGAYTIANLRVRRMGIVWLVEVFDESASADVNVEAPRLVAIGANSSNLPCIQTIDVGSVAYKFPSLEPVNNTAPLVIGPAFVDIHKAQFVNPNIAYIQASDAQGNPLTYEVISVTGFGHDASWFFSGNLLKTAYVNPGVSGATVVTYQVSDGWAASTHTIRVNWVSTVRG